MHELYELKEMLCKELEEIGGKGELTAGSLETVDTLAHALKNVNKIIEDKEEDGYSNRYHDGASYAGGRMNATRDSRGRYSGEGHGNYSSDGRGGYSRNYYGNYSRNDYSMAAGDMADRMRSLAADAPDETTRREIERMASKMEKM